MKLQYQHCRSIHLENLIKVFKIFYDYFFFQLYLQNNEKKVDFEYYKDLCTDYFRSNDPSALGNFITGKLVFSDTWFLWFWNRNPDEMYSKNTDLVVYRRKMILMTSYWHVFLKVRMNLQHGLNTRRESISRVGIYMNMFRFMWYGEIDFSRDVYSIYVPDFR